jgi:CRP-like cAMP-binding protein
MADDKQQYAAQISTLVPINEMPPHVQNGVVQQCNLIKVRKGGTVFKQGDRDEFSYYLLDGEIEMLANNQKHSSLAGGTDRARYAMGQLQPRQFTAKAMKPSVVMQIQRAFLDRLMVLNEKSAAEETTNYDLATAEVEVSEISHEDGADWMSKILQSALFSRMPTANIHALFAMLETVEFKAGDVVIKQGDPGQDYFIIQEGRCEVLRSPPSGGKDLKLAELHAGDSFGEEALISDTTRNATIKMLSNGILMRLSKDNFIQLIKRPTLQSVNLAQASKLVQEGGQWLDVRYKNEHDQAAIPGSINIPLNTLRMQTDKLDKARKYVVYCDTDGRSSTGAFLLAERGFEAVYLEGGLVHNSTAAVAAPKPEPAPAPKPAPAPAAAAPKPAALATPAAKPAAPAAAAAPRPAPAPAPAAKPAPPADPGPDVRASALEAELARKNMELAAMEKRGKDELDQAQKKLQEDMERRLREERAKIEQAKKAAEEEAAKQRKQQEERLLQMKAEAEKRLQEEKKKLEEVYSRNAEEMERLERMKQETAEKMRAEKQRLEREAEEAKKQLEEAQKMKKQIEASKRAIVKEAAQRQKEAEELERKIQEEAKQKLELERQMMAEQFARNNEELEKAKREAMAAEAARQAAKDEAARIIEEFKSKAGQTNEAEEARLREERTKLEEEQRRIRESMAEIERARREAEEAKRLAADQVLRLREQQLSAMNQSQAARESLNDELRRAEQRLTAADDNINEAQYAWVRAAEAEQLNKKSLTEQKELRAQLESQLGNELDAFRQELEVKEQKESAMVSSAEHMRRISEKANAARQAAESANASLLSDISSSFGKDG